MGSVAIGVLTLLGTLGYEVWRNQFDATPDPDTVSSGAAPRPSARAASARPVSEPSDVPRGIDLPTRVAGAVGAAVVPGTQPAPSPDASGPASSGDADSAPANTEGPSPEPFLQARAGSFSPGQLPGGASHDNAFPQSGPHFMNGGGFGGVGGPGGFGSKGSGKTPDGDTPGDDDSGKGSERPTVPFVPPTSQGTPGTTVGGTTSTTGTTGTTGDTTGNTGTTGTTTGETTGFAGTTGTSTSGEATGSATTGTTTTGETTTGFTTTGETTGELPPSTTGPVTTGLTTGVTADDTTGTGELPTIPEPATMTLLGIGACGVAMRAWRARR